MTRPIELPGPHPLIAIPNNEPVLRRTLAILRRVLNCTFYDGGAFQASQELRRDQLAVGFNAPEEDVNSGISSPLDSILLSTWRDELWRAGFYEFQNPVRPPYAPLLSPEPPISRLSQREIFLSGAALARVGVLRSTLPCKGAFREALVDNCLDYGWNLDVPPRLKRKSFYWNYGKILSNRHFVSRARALGYSKLAREADLVAAQIAQQDAVLKRTNVRFFWVMRDGLAYFRGADALFPRFALLSVSYCFILSSCLPILMSAWMFLNIYLSRGVGQPSSRRDRWLWSSLLIVPLGALCAWIVNLLSATGETIYFLTTYALAPIPTLVALLALVATVGTVMAHKESLVSRIADRWHTRLVPTTVRPWIEPLLLCVSALLVLIPTFWLVHDSFTPTLRQTTLIAGITREEAAQDLLIYGCASGILSFLVWLVNWRWPAKSIRPITHGGLRWYKEMLGSSICLLLWLYLLVALAAWPARAQARRMLDERWQIGDWAFVQSHMKSS